MVLVERIKNAFRKTNGWPARAVIDMGTIWNRKKLGPFLLNGMAWTGDLYKKFGIKASCEQAQFICEESPEDGEWGRYAYLQTTKPLNEITLKLSDENTVNINAFTSKSFTDPNAFCSHIYLTDSTETMGAENKSAHTVQTKFSKSLAIGHKIETLVIYGHTVPSAEKPVKMRIVDVKGCEPSIEIKSEREKSIELGYAPSGILRAVIKSPTPYLLLKAVAYHADGKTRKEKEIGILNQLEEMAKADQEIDKILGGIKRDLISDENWKQKITLSEKDPIDLFGEMTFHPVTGYRKDNEDRFLRIYNETNMDPDQIVGMEYLSAQRNVRVAELSAEGREIKLTPEETSAMKEAARHVVRARKEEKTKNPSDIHEEANVIHAQYNALAKSVGAKNITPDMVNGAFKGFKTRQ